MSYTSIHTFTQTCWRLKKSRLPAMFPRAQTACSLMCWWGDVTKLIKAGIAPPSTTAAVWFEVPEAMLVRAQEASNWIVGHSASPRKATNFGMRPALIIWSMGGCLSRDSSFLRPAQYSTCGLSVAFWQMSLPQCVLKLKCKLQVEGYYLAACVAWSCVSTFPPFTPVRISSTVHCRAAWHFSQGRGGAVQHVHQAR